MLGTGLVQQAFKSALLGGNSNLDNVADLALEAKSYELRFNSMLPDKNLSNAALIAGAGVATFAAIAGAYLLINHRITHVEDEREGFIDSVNANIVSFFIIDAKDKRRDSVKYVAAVINELQRNSILHQYARLLTKTIDKEGKNGSQYNVFSIASLPFGVHFDQPREDGDNVDEAIQAINFFLGGEFLELLKIVESNINHSFFNDTKLFFNAQEHIQDLNATRFIAIVLANIAINLVQGINPSNSLPLTTDELYKLCGEFRALLLKLKIGITAELDLINKKLVEYSKLELFIQRLEARINILQISYKDKLRNDLNLDDLVNGGYAVIQNATRLIRRFIYRDGRLENPSMFFSRLIDLNIEIEKNPNLLNRLIKKLNIKQDVDFGEIGLNQKPNTVIDFIAIYASQYRDIRTKALNLFKRESDKDFVETLGYFDKHYIQYVEDLANSYNSIGMRTHPINPAREYLVYFTSMMLESYNVTLISTKKPGSLSANEQALLFLEQALEDNAYYGFQYILKEDVKEHLKNYIKNQILFCIPIRQIALITTLTEIDTGYLQQQNFQKFIQDKLVNLQKVQQNFLDSKEMLIDVAARSINEKKTMERLIISEIDHVVPDKFTNLTDLCSDFKDNLDRAKQQISSQKFKERLNCKETELLADIQRYDVNCDNFEFYQGLKKTSSLLNFKASIAKENLDNNDFYSDNASVGSTDSNANWSSFKLKILNIMFISSGLLLLIGLVFLVLMTYGVHSLAALIKLSSEVQSALMITGFVSAAAAGIGLATSYFAQRFFNTSSTFVPVKQVDCGDNVKLKA